MNDFNQVASQITQIREFFVNEAMTTAQQVQAGTRQVQAQAAAPVVTSSGTGRSNGLFWVGLGTIAALAVAYCFWRR